MKDSTKLDFYKSAKQFFSKKENKFDVGPDAEICSGQYPTGLCFFKSDNYKGNLPLGKEESIEEEISMAVERIQLKYKKYFNYSYFPTSKDRMSFINKRIKELSRKR